MYPTIAHLRRWRASRAAPVVPLERVRRRLELVLAAVYGRTIRIEETQPERGDGWMTRLARRVRGASAPDVVVAGTDGEIVRLAPRLDAPDGEAAAVARYRLLAFEQAERVVRGTAALAPPASEPVVRDLYLLREATAVDTAIARTVSSARDALAAERASALARRPPLESMSALERAVERLVRDALRADVLRTDVAASDASEVEPDDGGAAASLAWARETAARLTDAAARGAAYRGVAPVALWGRVIPASGGALAGASLVTEDHGALPFGVGGTGGKGDVERADVDVAGGEGRESASPDSAPDARAIEEYLAGKARKAAPGDGDESGAEGDSSPDDRDPSGAIALAGVYPEWDHAAGRYHARPATVRVWPVAEGDEAWADALLAAHAPLVRRVRERFERLRSRRARLTRQRSGEELDLDACVRALVDRRRGDGDDDRLYVAVRPARRALAITLLVDVSGSTDAPVTPTMQVIDVEKEALLLASEALDALGDAYSVLTFSSRGASDVRVRTIKDFAEQNGPAVRRRVAAMAPEWNTRLGAALRHATAQLARQPAGHRLLLVLSDGKPHDMDGYHERYAIEDARQAVHEARASGVFPFCLTVDQAEPGYLSHVFGAAGHTILRHPEQLPLALVSVVRQLLGARGG